MINFSGWHALDLRELRTIDGYNYNKDTRGQARIKLSQLAKQHPNQFTYSEKLGSGLFKIFPTHPNNRVKGTRMLNLFEWNQIDRILMEWGKQFAKSKPGAVFHSFLVDGNRVTDETLVDQERDDITVLEPDSTNPLNN